MQKSSYSGAGWLIFVVGMEFGLTGLIGLTEVGRDKINFYSQNLGILAWIFILMIYLETSSLVFRFLEYAGFVRWRVNWNYIWIKLAAIAPLVGISGSCLAMYVGAVSKGLSKETTIYLIGAGLLTTLTGAAIAFPAILLKPLKAE